MPLLPVPGNTLRNSLILNLCKQRLIDYREYAMGSKSSIHPILKWLPNYQLKFNQYQIMKKDKIILTRWIRGI